MMCGDMVKRFLSCLSGFGGYQGWFCRRPDPQILLPQLVSARMESRCRHMGTVFVSSDAHF